MKVWVKGSWHSLTAGNSESRAYYHFWAHHLTFLDLEKIELSSDLPVSWPTGPRTLYWGWMREGWGEVSVWEFGETENRVLVQASVPASFLPSQSGSMEIPEDMGLREALELAREKVWAFQPLLAQVPLFPSRLRDLARRVLTRRPFLVPLKLVSDPSLGISVMPLWLEDEKVGDWVRNRNRTKARDLVPVLQSRFGKRWEEAWEKAQTELLAKKVLQV